MGQASSPEIRRVVAVGDLNGAVEVLRDILRGLSLINGRDRWIARNTHLIQVGDVFNRGGGAREAFALLQALSEQAGRHRSRVTVLLGNHEVMTTLRNEAYCTEAEYLSFATDKQRRAWPRRVERAMLRLYRDHPPDGPIAPLGPRLEAWKIDHVPGRGAMRRALGPRGTLGRHIRALPVAVIAGGCVFCHADLSPAWARRGIDGLTEMARQAWRSAPRFFDDLPRSSIFRASSGPLWNRRITSKQTARSRHQLDRALARLEVERMVVGHTPTSGLDTGEHGRIALRHDDRLVCIDVGLGRRQPSPRTALVIDGDRGYEWTPLGERLLWQD